jgi:glycosyltransferase involved in cell wall biosynthesis
MVFHSRAVYSHPPVGGLVAGASRRIVAISKTTAEPYARDHGDKIRIVPIGVDVERFCPPGAGPGGSLVGYLGRISPEKGLVNLVRSAPRIVSRVPSARFVVGGRPFSQEGERYLGAVRGEIKRRGLDDRFEWAGYVEDAPGFLARLSVVAVPSEEEGLGRTMLEAMAMERPVVAFDRGGPGETLTSGTDGVLVPPGDWDAMGNAIADLLADPETAALIGKAGRTRVEESYTGRASADALTDVYVEMVGGTR